MLLDNAAAVAQVRPFPSGDPGCPAIVTSRSRLSGPAVRDGARRLILDTLPEPAAVGRPLPDGVTVAADERPVVLPERMLSAAKPDVADA
jgi:hypothetical protein